MLKVVFFTVFIDFPKSGVFFGFSWNRVLAVLSPSIGFGLGFWPLSQKPCFYWPLGRNPKTRKMTKNSVFYVFFLAKTPIQAKGKCHFGHFDTAHRDCKAVLTSKTVFFDQNSEFSGFSGYFRVWPKQTLLSKTMGQARGNNRKLNKSRKMLSDTKIHPSSSQKCIFPARAAFT